PVQGFGLLLPVRASPAAVHGQGARRLPAQSQDRWTLEAGAPGRNLRATAPGAGALDDPDRAHPDVAARPARRRRGDRSRASVHADARGREAELLRYDVGDAWHVPHSHRDAPGIHATAAQRPPVTAARMNDAHALSTRSPRWRS